MKTIHAAIISWQGKYADSRHIAECIHPHVDRLTVIYSNPEEAPESGCGNWIQVNNSVFFGGKFLSALQQGKEDIFLLIHADAGCQDWPGLIQRCRSVHQLDNIGVWAPSVNHTPWLDSHVELHRDPSTQLAFVAQTDGIVFSVSRAVADRLLRLDYSQNNLGWGIDWAAICHSYTQNLQVVRDHSILLHHPQGSGYMADEARAQMGQFIAQLTLSEQLMYLLLNSYIGTRASQTAGHS